MRPIEQFVARAPWAVALGHAQVEPVLNLVLSRAAHENPGLNVDLGEFAASLAGRIPEDEAAPLALLEELHVADLYLAFALSRGDRVATARLAREHLPRLSGFIKKDLLPPPGELEQAVLTRLFLHESGEPRIVQYSGRGPFGAWLRMLAMRIALDLRRARRAAEPPALSLDSPAVPTDPELDYLKLRYAGAFKGALEQVLSTLGDRDVALLKLTFIDGLSASAIGIMYGVSGRTVQRWSSDIRATVLQRTRSLLSDRWSLSPSDLDSLFGLVQSQLHVSLRRVLQAPRGGQQDSDSSPP